ncbi:putative acyl-CoA desaturase [Helianthus annuus]|nr:putative acyl-CoA desaturase [Helianthus annuus]
MEYCGCHNTYLGIICPFPNAFCTIHIYLGRILGSIFVPCIVWDVLTLSYHRNLAHHSLKLPKWLEYTFAYFGVQAAQVLLLYVLFLMKNIIYDSLNL